MYGQKECNNVMCIHCVDQLCNLYTTLRLLHISTVETGQQWKCIDPIGRLMSFVRFEGMCWVWNGRTSGHKKFPYISGHGSDGFAHRVAYKLIKGEIPSDKNLSNTCGNHNCVNPDHYRLVSKRAS